MIFTPDTLPAPMMLAFAAGGLALLLLEAAAVLVLATAGYIIWRMPRPVRRTLGSALARGQPGDPADLGRDAEEITFRLSDGTTAPGWIIRGDEPDGPTVVFSHGWGNSRYGSLLHVAELAPDAAEVVVYDLRAHGDHSAERGGHGLREAADLVEVLIGLDAHRAERSGVAADDHGARRPLMLVGTSMGAVISIEAAAAWRADLPDAETPPGVEPAALRDAAARAPLAGVLLIAPYRTFLEPLGRHLWHRRWPPYPAMWLVAAWYAVTLPGSRRDRFDRARHARKIEAPVVVLHAEDDPICDVASGRAIAEAAPRGAFIPFEQGGHHALSRYDPDRYRAAIAASIGWAMGSPPPAPPLTATLTATPVAPPPA